MSYELATALQDPMTTTNGPSNHHDVMSSVPSTRREFLRSGTTVAAVTLFGGPVLLSCTSPTAKPSPALSPEQSGARRPSAQQTVIDLPFVVLRLLLPADGLPPVNLNARPIYARNVTALSIGKVNRWRHNKDEFHRNEQVEFALGYILRAKEGDRGNKRNGERPWSPGLQDNGSHVAVRIGWRAHKAVAVADDFFDGTFTCHLRLSAENGKLSVRCENSVLHWNGGLLHGFARGREAELSQKIQNAINTRVIDAAETYFRTIISSRPGRDLWSRTTVSVTGTTIQLIVDTSP